MEIQRRDLEVKLGVAIRLRRALGILGHEAERRLARQTRAGGVGAGRRHDPTAPGDEACQRVEHHDELEARVRRVAILVGDRQGHQVDTGRGVRVTAAQRAGAVELDHNGERRRAVAPIDHPRVGVARARVGEAGARRQQCPHFHGIEREPADRTQARRDVGDRRGRRGRARQAAVRDGQRDRVAAVVGVGVAGPRAVDRQRAVAEGPLVRQWRTVRVRRRGAVECDRAPLEAAIGTTRSGDGRDRGGRDRRRRGSGTGPRAVGDGQRDREGAVVGVGMVGRRPASDRGAVTEGPLVRQRATARIGRATAVEMDRAACDAGIRTARIGNRRWRRGSRGAEGDVVHSLELVLG